MRLLILAVIIIAIAVVALTTVTGFTVYPQSAGSDSYKVDVLGIGSLGEAGATYSAEALGYEIVSEMGGTVYNACLGWYCATAKPYNMHLTGLMKYSTTRIAVNTPVNVTAYNTSLNLAYSAINNTDSSGNLDITVPVPEVLIDAGFALRITIYGDVEAVLNKICIKDSANNKINCS